MCIRDSIVGGSGQAAALGKVVGGLGGRRRRRALRLFVRQDDHLVGAPVKASQLPHTFTSHRATPDDEIVPPTRRTRCCAMAQSDDLDLYAVLGVAEDASDADIRSAYKREALKWHPDKVKGDADPAEAEARFKAINHAFSCLLYTSPSPRDGLLSRMPSSA